MDKYLENKNWKNFKLGDIFTIENCKCSRVSGLEEGTFPYVGATNRNNGVINFVKPIENLITRGNCVAFICDGEGSIGLSIYRKSDFIGSTTVKVGRNKYLNEYNGQFITTIADKVRSKYNFGFKRNKGHLEEEILVLPTDSLGNPDFVFMESYMKKKEQEKLNKYRKFIQRGFSELQSYKDMGSLKDREWREFELGKLFNIKIGKNVDGNKVNKNGGKHPYITRKESANGLDGFINYDEEYLNSIYPVITIGNETAKPFVQQFPFFTGTKVNILSSKNHISLYSYRFVSSCLEMHKSKYSYSFTINSTRLKRQKIMLPVNKSGEPDYVYMENYMKKIEYEKLSKYLDKKYKKINS